MIIIIVTITELMLLKLINTLQLHQKTKNQKNKKTKKQKTRQTNVFKIFFKNYSTFNHKIKSQKLNMSKKVVMITVLVRYATSHFVFVFLTISNHDLVQVM